MADLKSFTNEELKIELENRKIREEAKQTAPKMFSKEEVKERLYNNLITDVDSLVKSVIDQTYDSDGDDQNYIWESVMKSFYGDNFFEWWNKSSDFIPE